MERARSYLNGFSFSFDSTKTFSLYNILVVSYQSFRPINGFWSVFLVYLPIFQTA